MSVRAFRLPQDLEILSELIPRSFQYPENPVWSVQDDEVQQMAESYRALRRVWPIFRFVQWFVPPLRDAMRGFIWEEDGQPVAVVNVLRQGMTEIWLIANVAVLPEYRRRGIARQLVEAAMGYARGRGADVITLNVVDGNRPAFQLYERLGFEHFTGSQELVFQGTLPPALPLPPEYELVPRSVFDWRPVYELAQRITPPEATRYLPVQEGQFRQPAALRPGFPIFMRAMGIDPRSYSLLHTPSGAVVGTGGIQPRRRAGGVNRVMLTLDPAHACAAQPVLATLLNSTLTRAPGRRVELHVPDWQTPLCEAAQQLGFAARYHYLTMGIRVH